ncbi:L,D-transpeptidase [Streptomyces mirabilis]|uniref:L,D-transpeptidase n=1 Tax=Streptomyces mirabilis TaxID=68239 RepID=A0ABU3UQV5_9ACTN|nr:L,D-transpeptidase [Streptomyces mirabilis]MDU8995874.1 L,D-transpeptidase [Streptomyces mirabilis]
MSDELASGLRELAQDAETPPSVSGAEIRLRAVRRRRRRFRWTAVTVAGACAAASLALVVALNLTGGDREDRPSPAASPTAPPSTPSPAAPDATVDLSRRMLTVAGRDLPISSGSVRYPTATGRMMVVTKDSVRTLSLFAGKDLQKVAWVIGLRAADGTTNFVGTLTSDEKAPGNYDVTTGWIGLRRADAVWLYKQLEPGAVIEIRGAATPTPATDLSPSATEGTVLPGGTGGTGGAATYPGRTADTPTPSVPTEPSVVAVPAG